MQSRIRRISQIVVKLLISSFCKLHIGIYIYVNLRDFPGDSVVRICLPKQETQETRVRSLGLEDSLEE